MTPASARVISLCKRSISLCIEFDKAVAECCDGLFVVFVTFVALLGEFDAYEFRIAAEMDFKSGIVHFPARGVKVQSRAGLQGYF